jgi:ribosomal protein S12 methylthiotransferase accessory factor
LEAKRHFAGTHRARPPEETWAWLRPQLPAYGVTRVADVTGLDDIGIPVFQAVRPGGRTLSVSQGKGITPMLARISAAMEALELWHAENVVADTGPVTAREWGGLPYDVRQLQVTRGAWWHDDVPVEWIIGEGLVSGRRIPVPMGCVRSDFTYSEKWAPPLFQQHSNGLAGGNTVTEATVHALCEVVERDTVAFLHRMPVDQRPHLDPSTVADAACRELLALFAAADVVTDVRHSVGTVGVDCFEVVGRAPSTPVSFAGYGCHPDPGVALARALTEAAQSRLTFIAGSRDDDDRPIRAAAGWSLTPPPPQPPGPRLDWANLGDASAPGLDQDQANLACAIAAATGREPIRVVLRSPTGVPVVRVVAPGLDVEAKASGRA